MKHALCFLVLLASIVMAKDKPKVEVQVVDAQRNERQYTYNVPGTASHSTTNCNANGSAVNLGGMTTANGTSNCTTTTVPGRSPSTRVRSVEEVHVNAIMPDGRHATLWCEQAFRHCSTLEPGSYTAVVDGNSVWMYTHDLGGKEHKIKYRYVGGW